MTNKKLLTNKKLPLKAITLEELKQVNGGVSIGLDGISVGATREADGSISVTSVGEQFS